MGDDAADQEAPHTERLLPRRRLMITAGMLLAACSNSTLSPTAPTAIRPSPVPTGIQTPTTSNTQLVAAFERFWNTFDQKYPFFVFKQIDWRALYDQFRPQAQQINTVDALLKLLQAMVAPLRDAHIFLINSNGAYFPTYRSTRPPNWNKETLLGYKTRYGWERRKNMVHGAIGKFWYLSIIGWDQDASQNDLFDQILEAARDSQGIIIDVRMNGGGYALSAAFEAAGRFTDHKQLAGYLQFRDGPLHTDLQSLRERFLVPSGEWAYTKLVALLIGAQCLSSNESFIAAMSELPQVTLFGDTTGGSSGHPQHFELGWGWRYTVPSWIEYTAAHRVIEWNGIAPDVPVATAPEQFGEQDPVIEAALTWLKAQ